MLLSVSPKVDAISVIIYINKAVGNRRGGDSPLESDIRFYARRLAQEQVAARTALTAEARSRRLALVAKFEAKLAQLCG